MLGSVVNTCVFQLKNFLFEKKKKQQKIINCQLPVIVEGRA